LYVLFNIDYMNFFLFYLFIEASKFAYGKKSEEHKYKIVTIDGTVIHKVNNNKNKHICTYILFIVCFVFKSIHFLLFFFICSRMVI
jgi:hypothetical protein